MLTKHLIFKDSLEQVGFIGVTLAYLVVQMIQFLILELFQPLWRYLALNSQ